MLSKTDLETYLESQRCLKDFQELTSILAPKFNEFFDNYQNKLKISTLLFYWLFINFSFVRLQGKNIVTQYLQDEINTPNWFMRKYLSSEFYPFKSRSINKFAAKFILGFLPIVNIVSGASNGWLKSKWIKVCHKLIQSLPNQIAFGRKKELVSLLTSAFSQWPEMVDIVQNKIPNLFYSEQLNAHLFCGSIICDGAPHALMDFGGLEKILLLNRNVRLIGRQHGGGYGVYLNHVHEFEYKLADRFIGWGLHENNEASHRFKRNSNIESTEKPKIILIENASLENYMATEGVVYLDIQSCLVSDYIKKELQPFSDSVYLKQHPLRGHKYKNWELSKFTHSLESQNFDSKKVFFVFDSPMSTLVYWCIVNNYDYIIVANRELSPYFTEKMTNWVSQLVSQKQLCYIDELGALNSRASKFLKPKLQSVATDD